MYLFNVRRVLLFALIFFFFFLPQTGFNQQLVYKFKQFTTNEGLPSSEVHQVLRDDRNFMWFATDHGVCRYDGYNFETFNLTDNSALSLYEDVKHRIWVATFSGRLFYYENGKFNDYKYNDLVVKMVEQTAINRIYVDSLDGVYVSDIIPSCFFIDSKGSVKILWHKSHDWIYEAEEKGNEKYFTYVSGSPATMFANTSLFWSNNAIIKIRTSKKNFVIKIPLPIHGRKNGLKKLEDGGLVFYTGQFLVKISQNGNYSLKKFVNEILDVKEVNDKKILVATLQNGLYVVNKDGDVSENYFQGLSVTGLEEDYEGGLWVSTTQSGLFYLNSLQIKHVSEKHVIIEKKFLCLDLDSKPAIWVGGESGSALYFEVNKGLHYYEFPIISINGIYSRLIPNAILICAGTLVTPGTYKLLLRKDHGKKFVLMNGISDIISRKGEIFGGTSNGVTELNLTKKIAKLQNKNPFRVMDLFLDSKGNILIGNLFGLWSFSDGNLHPYDSTKKILSSRITAIDEYEKQGLCLGTRGKGFLFLTKDSLYQIDASNGLASNNIRKIFIDENIIWLATNRGLSRLEMQSLNPFKYSIKNISVQDGLLSNEVNDIKRLDSNIIVATNGGISFFRRDLFLVNKQISLSLYITGTKINGLDTTVNNQYYLKYRDRNLSISFVALSFRESSGIQYRYRLLGIDSSWINISGREIQLNPVPYGQNIIQIQARRQGEEWVSQNSIKISIYRMLPFWRTIWFVIICFLIAVFLMLLFFLSRTRRIKQKESEKTTLNKKLAEMELKALRAQMNPHFIFNVLNSIQYYIMHNENEAAQHYMSKFAKLVRLTLDNSRSTFISLEDELSLLRLYIELEKIRFEDKFDYQISISDAVNIGTIKIPNMLLQPYVENSIKHGFKEKGEKYFLDISISKQNSKIVCVIEDNGIGRENAAIISGAKKEMHSSTGTLIIKDKIEAIKLYYNYELSSETLDIKDDNGNAVGTKVILTFDDNFDTTRII